MFHWKAFFILSLFFIYSLLLLQGDIESNPGGSKSKNHLPLFCHWNLNGLPAHNISKMLILKAYNAIYKYDFICLSETFLDSSIPSDHVSLELEGYKLVRADHPNNVKRGGVCIYYKESLPVRVINLPYLQEALLLELNDQNKKIIISSLYRSPSQNSEEFESFLTNFEHLLSDINARKPSVSVILGDFNARSTSWWSSDIDSLEGSKLFSLSALNGFHQIISEPTHVQRNSSSCIHLIFNDQPSLVINNGVHASLHPSCHHQIIHCTFNLRIVYPPPYQRLLWNCKKADVSKIQKALQLVNWDRLLDNKNVDSQVLILNDIILNIFRNFVPNKYVTFDDKDPVWMNENIKSKIKAKNKLYQEYVKKGRQETDFCALEESVRNLNDLMLQTKTSYYENLGKNI